MKILLFGSLIGQGLCMVFDEFYFHRQRGLGKWERRGHPLDTFSLLLCFAFVIFVPFSKIAFDSFIGLCFLSCFLITKDEWIHAKECKGGEAWLHSVLFILHPIVLISLGTIYSLDLINTIQGFLIFQLTLFFIFLMYQILFWNWLKNEKHQQFNLQ